MNLSFPTIISHLKPLVIIALATSGMLTAQAFDRSAYTETSLLASGKWVKVSVEQSGMHFIPAATLRSWGFPNPEKVIIAGCGGARISDRLTADIYVDDLPQIPAIRSAAGVWFNATGPVSWASTGATGHWRHSLNPWSTVGYYFIGQSDGELMGFEKYGTPLNDLSQGTTIFEDRTFHESEILSPGETGHMLVGEDFLKNRTQTFRLDLPGRVEDTDIWTETSFVGMSTSGRIQVAFNANGQPVEPVYNDWIEQVNRDSHLHGRETRPVHTFNIGNATTLNLSLTLNLTQQAEAAWLNYICVNYRRHLALADGALTFYTQASCLTLADAPASTRVFDVTDPLYPFELNVSHSADNRVGWISPSGGERTYVAFADGAKLPSPVWTAEVAPQNIHGMETPDMVIFTLAAWHDQAERLAAHHRAGEDGLKVHVLDVEQVYNEFGYGIADVNALRRCLKMFFDKPDNDRSLKYAMIFGRPTHDYRILTQSMKGQKYTPIPSWQTDNGLHDSDSFSSDDPISFLDDNSGISMAGDKLRVAIGRLPAKSHAEAKVMVDKILTYAKEAPKGDWKTKSLFIADDRDRGEHLRQTEVMISNLMKNSGAHRMAVDKVYLDAYDIVGSTIPGARDEMYRLLEEGTLWWNFIGHANPNSWTGDGLMTYNDINSLYLRRWPICYAATCDFLRWDSMTVSAAELLFKNPDGGVISAISATRPVYISENGLLNESVGRFAFQTDESGRLISPAEAMRLAKNDYRSATGELRANSNKLRFVFMGDPALRPATPRRDIVVTHINGESLANVADEADFPNIKASQNAMVEGYVADADGNPDTSFNGLVYLTLYDAEYTVTTQAHGDDRDPGRIDNFERRGNRLQACTDSVRQGHFRVTIPMPSEIADNYRPATLSLYARSKQGNAEAAIQCSSIYVAGYEENAETDSQAPVIKTFVLNHTGFKPGQVVNSSPMAIATIADNRGINLSMAGIGHQMTMWLDGAARTFTDVAMYYTPSADGSAGGTIAYPLTGLTDGPHTLRLRVWDTSGNPAEEEISFRVQNGLPMELYNVYATSSIASSEANFYLSHNRPDAMVNVTIEVFNLAGRLVWSSTQSGRSDLFEAMPVKWDLRDMGGCRVQRGIYLYRARVAEPGSSNESNTIARKIAITQ